MGLPSGTLWYSCNVGTVKPQGYGTYFAWGETITKDYYDWSTYDYGTGENALTKYCNNADNGLNGFTDGLTTLESTDDAATTILGGGARTPTQAEWQELVDNTTSEWTTMNGVYGRKFTASNGKSIFLPAAGNRFGSELYNDGTYGSYWSSSLYETRPYYAWGMDFYSDGQGVSYYSRYYGRSVRAVRQN